MVIVTRPGTTVQEVDGIRERVEALGLRTTLSHAAGQAVIGCVGEPATPCDAEIRQLRGVHHVYHIPRPYRRAAREFTGRATTIPLGGADGARVGGREVAVIAGPCSVEGPEMLSRTARAVKSAGASALRGGAFKPRTSPYAFQGLGREALELLAHARAETGLAVVSEVMDPRQLECVAEHVDVLQIGARNMQNYPLLREVGRMPRPVILKRGLSATLSELLQAAEYILAEGNTEVILCERGIRTFEPATRNTLDVAAIPVLKAETHLPVIVDPSHAGGRADLVVPLSLAAVAAGADGLLIEVHPAPAEALSDGDQSLTPGEFHRLMTCLQPVAVAVGRSLRATQPAMRAEVA